MKESTALSKNINMLQTNIERFIKANRNLVIPNIEKTSICWWADASVKPSVIHMRLFRLVIFLHYHQH